MGESVGGSGVSRWKELWSSLPCLPAGHMPRWVADQEPAGFGHKPKSGCSPGVHRSQAHAQVGVQASWAHAQVSCSSESQQEPGTCPGRVQPRELGEPGAAGGRAGPLNWMGRG